ncbi:GALT3 [Symbiodinium sp. CCMP2456]|nr:GALT3 [Symbiodinium sp. CCMP2456]
MGAFPAVALAPVALTPLAQGWRSECNIEGLDVQVFIHGIGERSDHDGSACRVAWLDHKDLQSADASELQGRVDFLFTDSRSYVPFRGRHGSVLYLENISEFQVPQDLDAVMQDKTQLLSVLMPPRDRWDELAEEIYRQAMATMPEHVFVEDGSLETEAAAFERYRFCIIPEEDSTRHAVSPLFVRSLAYHTIAVFNGFVEVGAMVFNAIADYDPDPFNLMETIETLNRHNKQLGALWHYQRIIQDQVQYRYNRPFEEKLYSQACTMCRLLADLPKAQPPLVFVGIYSARKNFEKRQAVRETWGRLLREQFGVRYRFFLGEGSAGASAEERRMRQELDEHNDLVFLPVTEGYRMNSRKGLLFLEWIAERAEAEFLLKTDDDVYLRPAPLLRQLQKRIPAQYAWAIFDYISPVPRDEDDNFYNAEEDFPFPVFPPYPRGVVRVLSMDVVRLLAKASQEGRLRMIYGDDPCIGVHLRQLLFDATEPLPSLTLDDFDNRVFAMEPSCHHNLWSKMTNRTWAIHHVKPQQILCMWSADMAAGYYEDGGDAGLRIDEDREPNEFPDLCSCATDESFFERSDLDKLQEETQRVLDDEEE